MESHIFQQTENYSKPNSKPDKVKVFLAILVLIFVGGTAFFAGKLSQNSSVQEPDNLYQQTVVTPTSIITPTKTLNQPNTSVSLTTTPTPSSKSKILLSDPEHDGYRASNGNGNTTQSIKIGRDSQAVYRGFISFDITSIPTNSEISEATLRLYQVKTVGNPYSVGGPLKIDHLTYGDSLDSSDYGFPALVTNFSSIPGSTTNGWKKIDVTQRLKNDLSNTRPYAQFRIHFQKEITSEDLSEDMAYFESSENTLDTGNIPQLVVKYY